MATLPIKTTISIGEVCIQQDANGRYSLNDLQHAAGGASKHRPSIWLENQQTKELIAELGKPLNPAKAGIPTLAENKGLEPVVTTKGTNAPGTFAVKELVYAFAMWISPAFHLAVIRAFDAMQQAARQAIQARPVNPLDDPELRRAINRKAHALSVRAFEHNREVLERMVLAHPNVKNHVRAIDELRYEDVEDSDHGKFALVDLELLFSVTSNARAFHRMQAFAIERLGTSIGRNLYE